MIKRKDMRDMITKQVLDNKINDVKSDMNKNINSMRNERMGGMNDKLMNILQDLISNLHDNKQNIDVMLNILS